MIDKLAIYQTNLWYVEARLKCISSWYGKSVLKVVKRAILVFQQHKISSQKLGSYFLPHPCRHVIGVTHDLHDQDFNLLKFIHFVQLEKKSLELADAFELPKQLEFVEY